MSPPAPPGPQSRPARNRKPVSSAPRTASSARLASLPSFRPPGSAPRPRQRRDRSEGSRARSSSAAAAVRSPPWRPQLLAGAADPVGSAPRPPWRDFLHPRLRGGALGGAAFPVLFGRSSAMRACSRSAGLGSGSNARRARADCIRSRRPAPKRAPPVPHRPPSARRSRSLGSRPSRPYSRRTAPAAPTPLPPLWRPWRPFPGRPPLTPLGPGSTCRHRRHRGAVDRRLPTAGSAMFCSRSLLIGSITSPILAQPLLAAFLSGS